MAPLAKPSCWWSPMSHNAIGAHRIMGESPVPWRVAYHEDQKVAEVAYLGATSASDIRAATRAAIGVVKEHEVKRGLIDCSEQTETGSIPELYELPNLYDDEGLSRDLRIAFVEPARSELRHLAVFYETVCLNRGWQVRRFVSRGDAVDWLRSSF